MAHRRQGILFIIAAPSGTGKSTVARRVVDAVPGLEFSVSFTTRPPRPGERDGEHYHFVTPADFERMARDDEFLESAEVFGHAYGTGRRATGEILGRGKDLVLDIDVQGARQLRQTSFASASIMILPPDFATLRARLRDRGSEGAEQVQRRLDQARGEAASYAEFDYVVVNDDLERAVEEVTAIVRAERRRSSRCGLEAQAIMASFSTSELR